MFVCISSFAIASMGCTTATDSSAATIDEATADEVVTMIATSAQPTTIQVTTVATTTQPTTAEPTQEADKKEDNEEQSEDYEETPEPDEDSNESVESSDSDSSHDSDSGGGSYADSDLLARVIYLEVGNCSEECQWLVGSTAMNLADRYGGLEAVATDYNTFNVAYALYDCEPSSTSRSVADRVLSGDRDYNVMAFRAGYYHDFGTPYTSIDNVYFSTY